MVEGRLWAFLLLVALFGLLPGFVLDGRLLCLTGGGRLTRCAACSLLQRFMPDRIKIKNILIQQIDEL